MAFSLQQADRNQRKNKTRAAAKGFGVCALWMDFSLLQSDSGKEKEVAVTETDLSKRLSLTSLWMFMLQAKSFLSLIKFIQKRFIGLLRKMIILLMSHLSKHFFKKNISGT